MRTQVTPVNAILPYSSGAKLIQIDQRRIAHSICATVAAAALLLALGSERAQAGRPVGIDVSSYQGQPNWSSIQGAGISFAWAKATEGTTIIDPDFTYNASHGKSAGVVMGGYDFAHPDANAPGSEAGYFWNEAGAYIKADGLTLMPMIDMEVFSGVVGASSYSDWANKWCNDLVANGQSVSVNLQPFIYVSSCNACEFDGSVSQWLSQLANYNGESDQTGNPWNVCTSCEVFGSGVWSGWQFTDAGSVSGVSGGVDMDVIHGSLGGVTATAIGVPPGEDLGGTFIANIACCSWASNRIDLLGVGTDGGIWHKWWDTTQWYPSKTGWQELPLGTGFHGDIGAVSMAPNRIDFFVQNANNGCSHGYFTQGTWYGMDNRGGIFASTIGFAACSWGVNRLDIFGVGNTSSNLWHSWFDGTKWYPWQNLGGTLTSTPGAVSWGPNRIDVFGRGTDGSCYQEYFTGGTWYGLTGRGGQFENYGFGVASEGVGLLDVFGVGGQAKPYELSYTGSWDSWTVYNQGTCTSGPSAVSWSPGRTDFFVRGPNNSCYHLYGQ